ncbi:WecB/TagA/CpsF family glycosyltransferase [Roseovarius sp. M141]|uniref:WecB/TagA/CpsF family glycosyltransferase n=1 Tax=Roseovarius sp. M141 TaxID=2583806 RepID=UPI0020CFB8E9|nr:WecB/TagA/CpsF family glycosyltransferase [Roseovarius sp. M141]MCQ0092934.1 WecB/TagA/CpsF family glycosyltransferase [Roseovarius sp. M141]
MSLITRNGRTVRITHDTQEALFATLRERLRHRRGFRLATVNLDHMTRIGSDARFARAYDAMDIVVADGRPIVWLSRLAGRPAQLMPGSDLVVPLARLATDEGRPIAMIGSTEEALQGAEAYLRAEVPGLVVAYRLAPPMGFDPEGPAAEDALRDLEASGAGLCYLALGAPKQEMMAVRGAALAPSVGLACFGAGLDFLAGHQRRAPRWMRVLALEWLWRALEAPRRMVPRYARCFAILPGLAWRAWRAR